MMPTHFMGRNPSIFHNGMQNYGTQSTPWVFIHCPVDMPSPLQSSPLSTYMNPNIGSWGTMAPMPMSLFDMSHVPQPTFMIGVWNLPYYESSPSYAIAGENTQMGGYCTYYTPYLYPSSTMSVPSNTFPMIGPHVSPGVSYGENLFYGSSNPLHETPSQWGKLYTHLNSSYHTSISS
jgi:hypothetical protein